MKYFLLAQLYSLFFFNCSEVDFYKPFVYLISEFLFSWENNFPNLFVDGTKPFYMCSTKYFVPHDNLSTDASYTYFE